jgi:E3 ubiquitin ligase SMURF1/2/E3 ubiquitin-protein ligase HUWE1
VVPKDALAVFDYQELDLLLSGVPDIDLDDWQRHTRYVGLFKKLGQKHPAVGWFWEVAKGFNQEERARLLQFTTGNARLPAQGFKALEANGAVTRHTLDSALAHAFPPFVLCIARLKV